MQRTLVIGDIHGGLKALLQVFEKSGVNPADNLIFLGDYVDGWSESAQTVEYLIDLSTKQSCTFIKGNHDVWCEQWLQTGNPDMNWLLHGGEATMASYTGIDTPAKQKHLDFFQQAKLYEIDAANRLFIHAGFTSIHGPQQEIYSSEFIWDRTLWQTAMKADKRTKKSSSLYPKRLKLFSEIFIGHTPTLIYEVAEPMHACNVWNLDTGAAFTGKLTIMDIDTKEYWQSEPVQKLYPGEKGRNRA